MNRRHSDSPPHALICRARLIAWADRHPELVSPAARVDAQTSAERVTGIRHGENFLYFVNAPAPPARTGCGRRCRAVLARLCRMA